MKINRKKIKQFSNNDNNLLPLVNIIFLLLIFFLLSGIIEKKRDLDTVQLPEATLDDYIEKESPVIYIYAGGSVKVGAIRTSLKDLNQSIKTTYPEIKEKELLVTADASITAKQLKSILKILNKIEIKKINLLTLKNE